MPTKQKSKIRQELGEKLLLAREKAKLTQAEVAEKAEIHVNYFARLERGEVNPSYEVLVRIIKALKIQSTDIFPC